MTECGSGLHGAETPSIFRLHMPPPHPCSAQLGHGNAPVSVCLRTGACNATPCYYAHPHDHVTQSHWKTTLLILSWINFPTNQANECLSGFCVPAVVLCARWFIIGKLVAAIAKAFKVAAAALAGLPPPSMYHRTYLCLQILVDGMTGGRERRKVLHNGNLSFEFRACQEETYHQTFA